MNRLSDRNIARHSGQRSDKCYNQNATPEQSPDSQG
jgi:hypothetical protein